MTTTWSLEMHHPDTRALSLITTDKFNNLSEVEEKIKQNREMRFVVQPPERTSLEELSMLDKLRSTGIRVAVNPSHSIFSATEIRVPTIPKSVQQTSVGRWYKRTGDPVTLSEPLVEIENDGVALGICAPATGVLSDINRTDGQTVSTGILLGTITTYGSETASQPEY